MKRFALLLVLAAFISSAFGSNFKLPPRERIVLGNGTVVLLNEKHDVPLIGLHAIIGGGAVVDAENKFGTAGLLATLLTKGAGERNAADFAEAIAAVGGTIDVSADIESISVSAEFMARDQSLMVELVADLLQRPTLAREEFGKLRERSINLIKAAKGGNPSNLMSAYSNAFLFGEHPYGNPVGGSESSLAAIEYDDLTNYYEQHLGGDRLVIAVSGDFDASTMRELLSDAFGEWRPATAARLMLDTPPAVTPGQVLLIDKPGATQAYFHIGGLGVPRQYSERADLDLANTVFGGRFTSMLVTELRTKSGLSYSARSALSRYQVGGSLFIQSFTQTEKTAEAIQRAVDVLQTLHDNGLDGTQLASAQNYVMGQFPPRFETAAQLAVMFATLEALHLDDDYIDGYGSAIGASSETSVRAAISEVYPAADALLYVVLGDAAALRDALATLGEITEISIDEPRFHSR